MGCSRQGRNGSHGKALSSLRSLPELGSSLSRRLWGLPPLMPRLRKDGLHVNAIEVQP